MNARPVAGDLGKHLAEAWKTLGKAMTAKQAFMQFLNQVEPRVKVMEGANGAHVKKLLALLTEADFDAPEAKIGGELSYRGLLPVAYRDAVARDQRDVQTYLAEGQRRAEAGDLDGAVRALSNIVEEFPARGDALRLVGYRLLDMHQAARAVSLFDNVRRDRPFEPHSYRDLARSLEESGKLGMAAVQV